MLKSAIITTNTLVSINQKINLLLDTASTITQCVINFSWNQFIKLINLATA